MKTNNTIYENSQLIDINEAIENIINEIIHAKPISQEEREIAARNNHIFLEKQFSNKY
jgi:hypothetical protein